MIAYPPTQWVRWHQCHRNAHHHKVSRARQAPGGHAPRSGAGVRCPPRRVAGTRWTWLRASTRPTRSAVWPTASSRCPAPVPSAPAYSGHRTGGAGPLAARRQSLHADRTALSARPAHVADPGVDQRRGDGRGFWAAGAVGGRNDGLRQQPRPAVVGPSTPPTARPNGLCATGLSAADSAVVGTGGLIIAGGGRTPTGGDQGLRRPRRRRVAPR